MDFVESEIKRVQKGPITHQEALQNALRVEQSMLEKKCFDMFIPNNQTIKDMLLKLNRETELHIKKLTDEMEKNKFTF